MRYFKLIDKNFKIFGIIDESNFRRFQHKHQMILLADIDSSEFIEYNNCFYFDGWMQPYPLEMKQYGISPIRISEIDQEEYQILQKSLQTQQQVINVQNVYVSNQELEIQPQIKQQNNFQTDETLQYVKKVKILELQHDNQKKITQGSDITLENGKTYHFSFDNMGLFNLITTMNTQQESQENISFILQKMNEFKQQCDSYCNSLIQQVQSSKDIKEINDIHYEKEGDN